MLISNRPVWLGLVEPAEPDTAYIRYLAPWNQNPVVSFAQINKTSVSPDFVLTHGWGSNIQTIIYDDLSEDEYSSLTFTVQGANNNTTEAAITITATWMGSEQSELWGTLSNTSFLNRVHTFDGTFPAPKRTSSGYTSCVTLAYGMTALTTVSPEFYSKYSKPGCSSIAYCFYQATSLTDEVLANIFKHFKYVTDAASSISKWTRTTMPPEVYKNLPNVESWGQMFAQWTYLTSIPTDLLTYMPKLQNIEYMFSAARFASFTPSQMAANLQSMANLSQITRIDGLFSQAWGTALAPVGPIRTADLLDPFTSVTGVNYTFSQVYMTAVEGVLTNNINIRNASSVFSGCNTLQTVPINLVSNLKDLQTISSTFSGCYALTSWISLAGLTKLYQISYLYQGCRSLPLPPLGLFQDVGSAITTTTNLNYMLSSSSGHSYLGPPVLAANFLDGMPLNKNTSMSSMYANNRSILRIPPFSSNKMTVTNMGSYANGCTGVTAAVPEFWNDYQSITHSAAFRGCTNAANYADIPADWK